MKQYLKALVLLATFSAAVVCCDNQSKAGLPPANIKGLSDASAATNFFTQVPYNQSTLTAGVTHLVETGNENLLLNPSFEHSTFDTSWTVGGSGAVDASETTNISSGKKSAKITFTSSTTGTFSQSVTPSIKMSGQQIDAGCDVKTSLTHIQVCQLQAGSVVGSCVNVPSTNVFTRVTSTQAGPSSGSVGVIVQTDGTSSTGDVYVDRCYVGYSPVPVTASIMTGYTAYTPTITGFGTATNVSAFWRRNGDLLEVYGYFTSGTTTGTTAQISLPSGLALDTAKTGTAKTNNWGDIEQIRGSGGDFAATNSGPFLICDNSGSSTTSVFICNGPASATLLSTAAASTVCVTGNSMTFKFSVPISGWNVTTTLNAASVLTSSDTNPERVERLEMQAVCTTGTCAVTSKTAGFSSVVFNATGIYDVNFLAGTWSSEPTCVCMNIASLTSCAINAFATTSSIQVVLKNSAGAAQNGQFNMICMGPH